MSCDTSGCSSRYWKLIAGAVILLLVVFFFRDLFRPGVALFTTDTNVGINGMIKAHLPAAFLGSWSSSGLLGEGESAALSVRNICLWLMPARFYTDWIHAIYLAASSLFLLLYFRAQGLGLAAGLLGVIIAFWLGSNFTLIYPAHIGKFGNLMFAALFLWALNRTLKSRRIAWALLTGGAMGAMFVEQPDVAFFLALVLGPYALFAAGREFGWELRSMLRFLAPLALMAALMAAPPLWVGYQTSVRGVASMNAERPGEKWEFCTQWSWPPEESIDFIAPGFMGWRSGEPEGPYWGRMGRSAGWETTHQGFQNFKLESQYLGAIPLALAFFAALAALAAWRRRGNMQLPEGMQDAGGRSEILFWSAIAVVTLLLAFGKYFPLYYGFYQLPVVSSIRNPNKFLQIFQLAVAILAAYGFELTIQRCPKNAAEQTESAKTLARVEMQRRGG